MISAKKILYLALAFLIIAILGFILELYFDGIGKYLIYLSVPIGAITLIAGGIGMALGKIKNDIK